jgi:hypothetical protein
VVDARNCLYAAAGGVLCASINSIRAVFLLLGDSGGKIGGDGFDLRNSQAVVWRPPG